MRVTRGLAAIAVGVDMAAGLGAAATGGLKFFRPAITGIHGAAVAVARLEGLQPEKFADVIGLAHAHAAPALHRTPTLAVFEAAGEAGLLPPSAARAAVEALRLLHALQAVLRLSTAERFDSAAAPAGLRHALLAAARRALPEEPLPDFGALERRLVESEAAARQLFDALCPPGAAQEATRRSP